MRSVKMPPEDDPVIESPENPIMQPEIVPSTQETKTEDKTEDKLIAQWAAELAAPMSVNAAAQEETETATSSVAESKTEKDVSREPSVLRADAEISAERLAMRQLQGRMRKNLLLKRPVPLSQDEESGVALEPEPVTPPEPELITASESNPAASTALSLLAPPGPSSTASLEVGLAAQSGDDTALVTKTVPEVNLKVGDKPEEPPVPEPKPPAVPSRQVIRIEKSSEIFTQLHTAIEYAVGNPNFHTDGLTDTSLFQGSHPIILGVTSAIAGEGKTTVALHLAMDIARNNFKKVCLMDMSLGEDTLSQRLEINTGAGLVNVLEGTHHTLPTIEAVDYEGLSLMPAGKTPDNAARAARSPAMLEILNAGRKLFDVIVVDMPSITSGNVLPIAPHLDAMVMVVYAGVTPKEVVAGALERLDKNKVLGVVLNRVKTAMPFWLQQKLNR